MSSKDESGFYLAASPLAALLASIFLVRGMGTAKYQLFWFLNSFVFVTLWGLIIVQLVRQSSVKFMPKIKGNIEKVHEEYVDLKEQAREAANAHLLSSLGKNDRSSAETTFANEQN